MKKIIFIILALSIFCFSSYVFAAPLMDMRNKIFEESKVIKSLLVTSKNTVLVNSMWDSCIITLTQLDAYFYMQGIFNTIKKEDLNEACVNYLINWLNEVKKTDELNIKSLNTISVAVEPKEKIRMEKLKEYFSDLNKQIDNELSKLSLLNQSLKKKNK